MAEPIALDRIGEGFRDPTLASQAVFREVLAAMASPGTLRQLATDADLPPGLMPASGALLLALLDPDVRLWLSDGFADGDAGTYLRFHTGCRLVTQPIEADYALIANPRELPALDSFACGSDAHPEDSATLVLQVDSIAERGGWTIRGPGIETSARLGLGGLDERFAAQWRANAARFPRGVDACFVSGGALCALSRTTRIEIADSITEYQGHR